MISNLEKEVKGAAATDRIVCGFNIFGVEDAIGVVRAAEEKNAPVFLMINRDALTAMPMKSWINMLLPIIEESNVPIGIHLDHCSNVETVVEGIRAGFTSVMYDGSQLPIEENIENCRKVARVAREYGVLLEGEIGSVPYADIPGRAMDVCTEPGMLARFACEGEADWIAVAVGQTHRLHAPTSKISFDRLHTLETLAEQPLVIHGGSGISREDFSLLKKTRVGKINIGTALRIPFFKTLKEELYTNPEIYDRGILFEKPTIAVEETAKEMITLMGF